MDENIMLPEGWSEDVDIFAEWEEPLGEPAPTTEPEALPETPPEDTTEDTTEEPSAAPTTEQTEEGTEGEVPTTESKRLKFKAKVDHEDRDVDLDESELPTIWQKAQVTDRVQAKLEALSKKAPIADKAEQLARMLGFDDTDSMLSAAKENHIQAEVDKLVEDGVHEAVARELVENRMARGKQPDTTPAAEPPTAEPSRSQVELDELYAVRPELRNKAIPDEVIREFAKGTRLIVAYQNHLDEQKTAEAVRLAKENRVLKQNAAAAAKAPVKGTKGGGAATAPMSAFDKAFLAGFDSDGW